MPFSDLITGVDDIVDSVFNDFDLKVHPQGSTQGSAQSYLVTVTQSSPQFQDDYIPGVTTTGAAILHLFIGSGQYRGLTTRPVKGDTASLNGTDYDVADVIPDGMGAATMHLRKRNIRWYL